MPIQHVGWPSLNWWGRLWWLISPKRWMKVSKKLKVNSTEHAQKNRLSSSQSVKTEDQLITMIQEASPVWHYGETLSSAGWFHHYEWRIMATHEASEPMSYLAFGFLSWYCAPCSIRHDQKTQWELTQQAFFIDVTCFYISLVCRCPEFSITLKPKPVLTTVEYSLLIARLTTTQGDIISCCSAHVIS